LRNCEEQQIDLPYHAARIRSGQGCHVGYIHGTSDEPFDPLTGSFEGGFLDLPGIGCLKRRFWSSNIAPQKLILTKFRHTLAGGPITSLAAHGATHVPWRLATLNTHPLAVDKGSINWTDGNVAANIMFNIKCTMNQLMINMISCKIGFPCFSHEPNSAMKPLQETATSWQRLRQ